MDDVLISSDVHIAEPFDLFTSRLPKRLRDRAARLEHIPDGDLMKVTIFGKNTSRARYILPSEYVFNRSSPVSWKGSDSDSDIAAGLIRDLEADGVFGAMVGPDQAREAMWVDDHELAFAHARAYNDFVVEAYGPYLDRLALTAAIPLTDIGDAVAEIERVSGMGLRCLAFPSTPPQPFFTDTYDRVWATAQAHEMVVTFHVATGFEPVDRGTTATDSLPAYVPGDPVTGSVLAAKLIRGRSMAFPAEQAIASLVGSGVTERFPELHFVFVEFGAYWLAPLMASMEKSFTLGIGQDPTVGSGVPSLDGRPPVLHRILGMNDKWPYPLRPSEYVRRQIHVTFQDDPGAIAARHLTGIEPLLWGNDYPHPEATYPRSLEALDGLFSGVPAEERAAIVGRTAATLFGITIPRIATPWGG